MVIKKYLKAICLIVLCVVLTCGCKHEEENISKIAANDKMVKGKKLNIDAINYIGISGRYFYYMVEIGQDSDVCDHDIMRYDLQTDKTDKVGEIAQLSTWSGIYAFANNNKLYGTFGVVENGQSCNKHIKFDLNSGKTEVLSTDYNFPPLVQNIAVDENCFVEYQPILNENGTYRYVVRITNTKSGDTKDVIVRKQNIEHNGESIIDTCVYGNTIFTFEYDAKEPYVCSYDLDGNQISKENVELINEFLNMSDDITGDTETMWSIDVINGYYFFESLNGKRLVLYKKDGVWIKREDLIMDREGSISNLIDNFNPRGNDYTKVVLYDYNIEELSYLDTITGEKIPLNIELPGATYCMTDGKQLIYANEQQELYYIEDIYAK